MTSIIEKKQTKKSLKIKLPPLYNVIFHNDDVTTFDFVVVILIEIFGKSLEEATVLAIKIHENGKSVVAQYSHEIAMSKKEITDINSKNHGFPLVCEVSKD